MSEASHILKLTWLSKSFGGVQALSEVSFELRGGEVHALVGENGAGKSTLVKIVSGAEQPDDGMIEFDGREIGPLDPQSARKLGIAVIHQQPALFPDLSVAENIALGTETPRFWRRVRWRERHERAARILEQIGARIDPSAEAGCLTMPQQQLVEIAKALVTDARVLILDEPTASLSDSETAHLFSIIRRLKSQGVGLIYISHRLDELPQVADCITVLRDGRVVEHAPLTQLSRADLIRLMVGRELSAVFPKKFVRPETAPLQAPLPLDGGGGEGAGDVASNVICPPIPGPSSARGEGRKSLVPPRSASSLGTEDSVPVGELLLEARRLSCRDEGICEVSLTVRAGEIIGLAGLMGAGRTELARVLFGLSPADGGEIFVRGKRVIVDSPARAGELGLAYVPEDRRRHGVILEQSVAANTSMALLARQSRWNLCDFSSERRLAGNFVERLGTKTPSVDVPVGNLSGGNQQKVALARWLATNPSVLILDEPTQGIDVGAKAEIHRLMTELAERGLGVLMISSDLPEVLGMSDRILVMHAGTIAGELDRASATQERIMELALGHGAATGVNQ